MICDYDALVKARNACPDDPGLTAALYDCVVEATGYPLEYIQQTNDPTGHTMAMSLVLAQTKMGGQLRRIIVESVEKGAWWRRPILVAWGYSHPTVTGVAAREYAGRTGDKVRHPGTRPRQTRHPVVYHDERVQVGHLWVLREAARLLPAPT